MHEGLSRVKSVRLIGLFQFYNHEFKLKMDSRITIIHGPNGVGKTMLLKLIAALFRGRYLEISRVPFEKLQVELTDGSSITVSPRKAESSETDGSERPGILISVIDPDGDDHEFLYSGQIGTSLRLTRIISLELPWLDQISRDTWFDSRSRRTLGISDVMSIYGPHIPTHLAREIITEPEWLVDYRSRVSIHFIETQRLLKLPLSFESRNTRVTRVIPMVQSYADLLRARISLILTGYANESQSLDQSFPQRLLSGRVVPLSVEELKVSMQQLETRRETLRKIGLVAGNDSLPLNLDALDGLGEPQRDVMSLYVGDSAKKLDVLNDLADRIALLLEIVNRKFRHKRVGVNRDNGFIAIDDNGAPLDLDALSSGEQHELVLIYDLLFTERRNSLVLIDEPELSLHVTWQKAFIPDLQRIVHKTGFDVLLATHSPFIVGENVEMMVNLSSDLDGEVD